MPYQPTIGLEIHAELNTASKMFCSCKNDPDEKRPNYLICPTCAGHPGTLPVANEEAIKKVIKTGLALNCKIAEDSKFDRKNYFYPDLPKGYQISQYDQPLCEKGYLEIDGRKIGITRIHLEEDTGSLLHPEGADYSLVNLNRAGVPLMELVTEPDITSGSEAKKFAEQLQLIFRYLGVSDADMEKGLMRVEVNISVSRGKTLGTKVEIKNLNSFRVVQKAIDFEISRQTELLENGGKVVQETRGWHDKKEITFSQREKESAHDYRYFPEPDLPALHFTKEFIKAVKAEIPELPEEKSRRFSKEYGLDETSITVFIMQKDLSEYFEKVVSEFDEWLSVERAQHNKQLYRLVANYLISDVNGLLAGKEFIEKDFKITPENFAEFIKMIYKQEISSKVAKMVLAEMYNTGVDPSSIVDENKWGQMSDSGELEKIIQEVIVKNQKAVADYKSGNKNAIQFLSGQVMAATRGTANPQSVQEVLKKLL
ncbi:MAG: glutaminyl-tRNA synthase (glutamine-hydrolyzing) subunit B [Candidatus Staskawiczbacteria bacterium RIFCSPLOWO2_01_FULL_40_39]|uniref:Aspartyl/glutamyl-tRNA(Asn/Gln) amidotransferase subunit B n=1 Tax=Candidatus Staskawiczbacteria bacterium RIFCSPHIGHO2_01_FULL_39_25 TaxID=1802202 RepID=A0A1G2HQ02_9BACT|nr:MAG: glutaminyl-tRNA synthase (glutamine-hydrolyzing) subunit B [Candidatus Staskawiczbacteria bacterium RIFCSPHIGHO2_01_FULL_39_25]OGZ72852.1 MAG: glutaminyl-tRNA synthase (glutamine-hydrolyzing) subunit B [Candidatus Staskawiczbacteria bacterium RIFCSPLOWO2_01_FULL_40_39]OGZ75223.1 MAG: glutaminyl-tRNA synthase (glutamine-hydrolyzing) subunit B [Candidatus Staskawiczbacteria bacterium RIFCSPLOWO2_02_FULL_39_8]